MSKATLGQINVVYGTSEVNEEFVADEELELIPEEANTEIVIDSLIISVE